MQVKDFMQIIEIIKVHKQRIEKAGLEDQQKIEKLKQLLKQLSNSRINVSMLQNI